MLNLRIEVSYAESGSRLTTASRENDHIAQLSPTGLNKFWNVQNSTTRTDWTKIQPKTVGLSFKSDHIARRDSTKLFCRVESLEWSHRLTRFNSFVELSRVGRCDQGLTLSSDKAFHQSIKSTVNCYWTIIRLSCKFQHCPKQDGR